MSGRQARRIVPSYTATGGRAHAPRHGLDQLTFLRVRVGSVPDGGLDPPHLRLLDVLAGAGPGMTLAETAAALRLPVAVTRVLAGDLVNASLIEAHAPVLRSDAPDITLLERVLDGLRKAELGVRQSS
ncbi:hypothetical protein KNE206_30460 [Kitasatospora sp. NE20-6]|uniref:DUF742 domain-containing protein n=1 Tax=Kitasatospora sp. NE20-6 TaxID=2859066 RepID=UPI0034DBC611